MADELDRTLSEVEILERGLEIIGFGFVRRNRVSLKTNEDRFLAHYGLRPNVAEKLWEDLVAGDHIKKVSNINGVFLALFFLFCYPTQQQMSAVFCMSCDVAGRTAWYFVGVIASMKDAKVSQLYFCEIR
jgi:hypothetical protein